MPDTPDAAPDPTPDGPSGTPQPGSPYVPAGPGEPLPISALPATNGAATDADERPAAEEAQGSSSWFSLENAGWVRSALAAVVLAAGAVASGLGARAIARSDADSSRQNFQHASAGAVGSVELGARPPERRAHRVGHVPVEEP